MEEERAANGEVVPVATIFLTNRECPWRCVMCDLWKNTLREPVVPGAIPRQIEYALERLPAARQIKLYNSGSFFDEQAIPREDYGEIARLAAGFERTIVECHPALVGTRCLEFCDLLGHPLEVAMGLETAHPEVLERLNKRMTLDQFARAAEFLRSNGIDLRVFVLVQPPFMPPEEALHWAMRSLDFAFDCGATAVSLIPTRSGNGAMEALRRVGEFTPPSLATLEDAVAHGVRLKRGLVFADLWDLRRATPVCHHCYPERIARLHAMNLGQQLLDAVDCKSCEGKS
ncbi:MAG: radical SAM protein [Terracidiphilus sp.]